MEMEDDLGAISRLHIVTDFDKRKSLIQISIKLLSPHSSSRHHRIECLDQLWAEN